MTRATRRVCTCRIHVLALSGLCMVLAAAACSSDEEPEPEPPSEGDPEYEVTPQSVRLLPGDDVWLEFKRTTEIPSEEYDGATAFREYTFHIAFSQNGTEPENVPPYMRLEVGLVPPLEEDAPGLFRSVVQCWADGGAPPGTDSFVPITCTLAFQVLHEPSSRSTGTWTVRADGQADAEVTLEFIQPINDLDVGFDDADAGPDADLDADPCADTPCSENGTVTMGPEGGCVCECSSPTFFGPTCEDRVPDVTTLAGGDGAGFDETHLDRPSGLALTGGLLYVADSGNRAVRTVDIATGQVQTIAGGPLVADGDGPVATAGFANPLDVAVATDGTLYVTDAQPPRIRAVAGGAVTTLDLGTASIGSPKGVTLDGRTLYVAAGVGVGRIDLDAQTFEMIAGGFEVQIRDGVGTAAGFAAANDLVVAPGGGSLFVVDAGTVGGGALRQLDLGTMQVTTVVGALWDGSWQGPGPLTSPSNVVALTDADVIVSEAGAHRIRRFRRTGTFWASEPFAGDAWTGTTDTDGEAGFVDGQGDSARFEWPRGVVIAAGNPRRLFIADSDNHAIRAAEF